MNDTDCMLNFSDALDLMKKGVKMLRNGWEKENMFCYYVPEGRYDDLGWKYGPMLALHTKFGFTIPWRPEQDDVLAKDWCIYADEEDMKNNNDFSET